MLTDELQIIDKIGFKLTYNGGLLVIFLSIMHFPIRQLKTLIISWKWSRYAIVVGDLNAPALINLMWNCKSKSTNMLFDYLNVQVKNSIFNVSGALLDIAACNVRCKVQVAHNHLVSIDA